MKDVYKASQTKIISNLYSELIHCCANWTTLHAVQTNGAEFYFHQFE